MKDKTHLIKKILAVLQEIYSIIVIAVCIYFLAPAVNIKYMDTETIFVLTNSISIITINVLLFIFVELLSKRRADTSEQNYKRDIINLICIIVFDCICVLCYIAFFVALSYGIGSSLNCLAFGALTIPLLANVILASILINHTLKLKSAKPDCENLNK